MTFIASMSFTECRSFLILRRIDSGRASVPSKRLAQFYTVPRCWEEPFLLRVPIPIASGCFYQGMPMLPLHREPRRSRRLRISLRLLPLPLVLTLLLSLLLLLLPLLLPMLLHLLLVRSGRRVHNIEEGLIHCNCNCGSFGTRRHLHFRGERRSITSIDA
jgi:hypothetical protein